MKVRLAPQFWNRVKADIQNVRASAHQKLLTPHSYLLTQKRCPMNILLWLAYKGTNYSGFQVQPNGVTVCAVVQDAMQSVFGTRPDVKGCSRTDAGVHARRFALNFHYDGRIPVQRIPLALNARLPMGCGRWQRSRCRMISTPAMPPTPKPTTTACGAARWMIPLIMRPATGSTAPCTLPPCRRRRPFCWQA